MPSPLTSSQFVRLLDTRLREVSEGVFKELPSMISTFYSELSSDSAMEEFYEVGNMPDVPEFTGKLQYMSIAPGYHNKIEPKEFAGGVMMERKLIDDKKFAVLDARAEGLSTSAHRVKEKYGVRPFAYAFSAAFDFQTSEEGLSLCNSAHTTKSGVSTSNGFSNSGTSAFSKTAINATRILMRKFRDDIGERIVIEPDTLIVPDNLYDQALEITQTANGLYTSDGTKNVNAGRWKVIPYLRLDDYSTNNWFMVDYKLMKRFLLWINRVAPEVNNTVDFDSFIVKHSIYFRIGNGFTNWRWIFGHNV